MGEPHWSRQQGLRVAWKEYFATTMGDVMWDGNVSGDYVDHIRVAVRWDEDHRPGGPLYNWVPGRELRLIDREDDNDGD